MSTTIGVSENTPAFLAAAFAACDILYASWWVIAWQMAEDWKYNNGFWTRFSYCYTLLLCTEDKSEY